LHACRSTLEDPRLNFSHGNHAEFARIIQDLRSIESQLGRPIGILADIQGPKLRVAKLEGGKLTLPEGAEAWITTEPVVGGVRDGKIVIPTVYKDFAKDVGPGNTVLLDDGLMCLKVLERQGPALRCKVVDGGVPSSNS
jgi:Pyruvate kinase